MYALAGGAAGVEDPALTLYGHLGDATAVFDVTHGGDGYFNAEGARCGAHHQLLEFGPPAWRFDCGGTASCNPSTRFDGPPGGGGPAPLSLFEPLLPLAFLT